MLIACSLILGVSPAIKSADGPQAEVGSIPVHYDAWELAPIVNAIGHATGHTFIHGDDLRGRVSVTVPSRVTPGEALELLNAILFIQGFAAIPIDKDTSKIVKMTEVSSSAPRVDGSLELTRDRPVTTLLSLQDVSAESVVTALGSLVSKDSVALAYPPTNSIILAGSEGQIARLMTLSRLIDRSAKEEILVRSLRYRDAETIANVLEEISLGWSVRPDSIRIWSDSRSNQIIAHAEAAHLLLLSDLIEEMDQPVEASGGVQVVRIMNREAQEVADQLDQLKESGSRRTQPRSAPQGGEDDLGSDVGSTLVDRTYSVTVDEPTQSLILIADPDTMWTLKQTIAALDQIPARVVVDVVVMEVRKPTEFALGFNFFLPLLTPSDISDPVLFVASGADVSGFLENPLNGLNTGVPSTAPEDSTFFGRYAREPIQIPLVQDGLPEISLSIPRDQVAVEAEDTNVETSILLRPHLTLLSGEENEIFAGENLPIPVSTTSGAAGNTSGINPATSTAQNIERTDVGVDLKVKPTVGQAGAVNLEIDLRLSQIAAPAAGSVEEVGPTLIQREIQTTLSLKEGRIAVIGGQLDERTRESRYGIPFLRDIPGLGYLFGGMSESTYDLSLVMIVSAHVLSDMDEQIAETIRRRLAMQRSMRRDQKIRDAESEGFAVLLDTVSSESKANFIADSFRADGFEVRVSGWDAYGQEVWDIYLVSLQSIEEAGALARSLSEAGWFPELTFLSNDSILKDF